MSPRSPSWWNVSNIRHFLLLSPEISSLETCFWIQKKSINMKPLHFDYWLSLFKKSKKCQEFDLSSKFKPFNVLIGQKKTFGDILLGPFTGPVHQDGMNSTSLLPISMLSIYAHITKPAKSSSLSNAHPPLQRGSSVYFKSNTAASRFQTIC